MDKRKGVMLILDGLGDHAVEAFGDVTPLEAAATPNMDRMLRDGQGGLVDPLYPGVPVGTHNGTAVLLGITPSESASLARGPVEAAGIGLESRTGDVLFRCNFATLQRRNGGYLILDRRAGRISEGASELAEMLNDVAVGHGISATLKPATQHRAVLHLAGTRLSAAVSDTDPGHLTPGLTLPDCRPLDKSEDAKRVARAVNDLTEIAFERLDDHPVNRSRRRRGLPAANGIICRSPGIRQTPTSLINHLGLRAAVIAGESTVLGLGRLLGYRSISDPRFTALQDTDLSAKVETTLTALAEHDIVFLHVKGPDICSHDHDPSAKKELLEAVDRALLPLLDEDIVISVTGDHSTDSNTGRHIGDPVPSLLYARRMRRDRCSTFGEAECAMGGLGRLSATGLLSTMLDNMGRMHKLRPGENCFFCNGG